MTDIRRVPSSEFRVTYVREQEPVAVTILGRVVGFWIPGGQLVDLTVGEGANQEIVTVVRRGPAPRSGQEKVAPEGFPDAAAEAPGRSEAPEQDGASTSPPAASVAQSGASSSRSLTAPGTSKAGMTQADKDRVLGRVAKGRRD